MDLHPVPDAVLEVCRATQRRAEIPVLCPIRLPRPVRDLAGSTALPPPVLTAFPWREDGVDISPGDPDLAVVDRDRDGGGGAVWVANNHDGTVTRIER